MKDLSLNNFISGSVFKYGIEDTILNEGGTIEGSTDLEYTFLIVFNSEENKIIAASRKLNDKDIDLDAETDKNGSVITIKDINSKYTKNYLSDGENYIADGFALIRAKGIEESVESETVLFPDLNSNYNITLKGKLSNNPVFSNGTKFQFNLSTITFGVTGINEN